MDAKIRREALKAAAKVALSLAAVGTIACGAKGGGQDQTEESASTIGASPSPSGSSSASATPTPTPAPTPSATASGTPTYPSCDAGAADAAPDLGQCEAKLDALVAARIPNDAEFTLGTAFESTPENVACCTALLQERSDGIGETSKHRWDCCATLNGEDNIFNQPPGVTGFACTPWGPPMPPSMPTMLRVEAVTALMVA